MLFRFTAIWPRRFRCAKFCESPTCVGKGAICIDGSLAGISGFLGSRSGCAGRLLRAGCFVCALPLRGRCSFEVRSITSSPEWAGRGCFFGLPVGVAGLLLFPFLMRYWLIICVFCGFGFCCDLPIGDRSTFEAQSITSHPHG